MKQTVLNVVRHTGGQIRLGVIGNEFRIPTNKVILKGFAGLSEEDSEFVPSDSYYEYGSIFSEPLHNWLVSNNYYREANQDIWLIKAYFEVSSTGEHTFTFVERSPLVKRPKRNLLFHSTPQGSKTIRFRGGNLINTVWQYGE